MRLMLFSLIFLCSTECFCQTVYYYLSELKEQEGKDILNIQMEFESNASGVTKLILPNQWIDADRLYENIIDLRLKNRNVSDVKIVGGDLPHEKYVVSKPSGKITLSYNLINNDTHYFKPIIKKKYFSFIGKTAFVMPKFENEESHKVILNWNIPIRDANSQAVYRVVNSFGLDSVKQEIDYDQLSDGVFLGGDITVSLQGDVNSKIIFAYNKPSLLQENWEKDAREIIDFQRTAMKAENVPYYLVSMIEKDDLGKQLSATHLNHGVVFIHGKDWLHSPRFELIRYTAHEFLHHWIGGKIKASDDYVKSMWFFEGFTDYLSIELALQSKHLSEEEYIDIKNRILWAHYVSPFQKIPNGELALYYWDNPELHGVPYIKGHLFAQFCDNILKKEKKSLLGVISSISNNDNVRNKKHYKEADLIRILSDLVSNDIYEQYVKYFIKCDHFDKNIDLNLGNHHLSFVSRKVPRYDFDLTQSFIENRVIGLSKGSASYQLGLREGYLIDYFYIDPLLKTEEIKISFINHNGELKKIELKPQYQKIKMPFFTSD